MKQVRYYITVLLIIFVQIKMFPQMGWEVLVSGTGYPKDNLYFIDSLIGFYINTHDGVISRLGRTSDGGHTWNNTAYYGDGYVTSVHFPDKFNGYISFADYNSRSIILKSTDLGETWNVSSDTLNFSISSIFFTSFNSGYAVGGFGSSSGRIARTSDGGLTWADTSFNYRIYSLHFSSEDIGYAIGGDQTMPRILKTTDAGVSWISQSVPSSVGNLHQIYFANDSIGYIVSYKFNPTIGYIIKTENGGNNWYIQYSLQNIPLRSVFVINENITYVVGYNGTILKTTNGGLLWYLQESQTSEHLQSVFFLDDQNGFIGGGVHPGGVNYIHVLLKTITGGEPIPVELTSFNADVNSNSISLLWSTASELNNMGFELFRNGNKIIFIEGIGNTTETQSYSYTDQNLMPGIYNYKLEQIDYDGTRTISGELTIYLTIPETFSLEQNYPNPFNPVTNITFSIPISSEVVIRIYDILGEEVTTLISGSYSAGTHTVQWDAGDLPSGMYLCSLQAGDEQRVIKLLLMK